MRRRLEDAYSRPTLDFLVSTLRLANDAENLEYLGWLFDVGIVAQEGEG